MENLFHIFWIFFMIVGALVGMMAGHLEDPDDPSYVILLGFLGFLLGIVYFVVVPMVGLYFLTKYLANKFIRVEHSAYGYKKTYYIGNWKIN